MSPLAEVATLSHLTNPHDLKKNFIEWEYDDLGELFIVQGDRHVDYGRKLCVSD